jgi:hypothetical protein
MNYKSAIFITVLLFFTQVLTAQNKSVFTNNDACTTIKYDLKDTLEVRMIIRLGLDTSTASKMTVTEAQILGAKVFNQKGELCFFTSNFLDNKVCLGFKELFETILENVESKAACCTKVDIEKFGLRFDKSFNVRVEPL